MKLKKEVDIQNFLETILTCKGEVFYHTRDGDHLNLKSQLSQFVFAIIYSKGHDMLTGEIMITDQADMHLLSDYLDLTVS